MNLRLKLTDELGVEIVNPAALLPEARNHVRKRCRQWVEWMDDLDRHDEDQEAELDAEDPF